MIREHQDAVRWRNEKRAHVPSRTLKRSTAHGKSATKPDESNNHPVSTAVTASSRGNWQHIHQTVMQPEATTTMKVTNPVLMRCPISEIISNVYFVLIDF